MSENALEKDSPEDFLRQVRIIDKDGQMRPLKLNRFQWLLWNAFVEAEKKGERVQWSVIMRGRVK